MLSGWFWEIFESDIFLKNKINWEQFCIDIVDSWSLCTGLTYIKLNYCPRLFSEKPFETELYCVLLHRPPSPAYQKTGIFFHCVGEPDPRIVKCSVTLCICVCGVWRLVSVDAKLGHDASVFVLLPHADRKWASAAGRL